MHPIQFKNILEISNPRFPTIYTNLNLRHFSTTTELQKVSAHGGGGGGYDKGKREYLL